MIQTFLALRMMCLTINISFFLIKTMFLSLLNNIPLAIFFAVVSNFPGFEPRTFRWPHMSNYHCTTKSNARLHNLLTRPNKEDFISCNIKNISQKSVRVWMLFCKLNIKWLEWFTVILNLKINHFDDQEWLHLSLRTVVDIEMILCKRGYVLVLRNDCSVKKIVLMSKNDIFQIVEHIILTVKNVWIIPAS